MSQIDSSIVSYIFYSKAGQDRDLTPNRVNTITIRVTTVMSVECLSGSCHKRQKAQAPIRNRQTRKVANAKDLSRNTNLT